MNDAKTLLQIYWQAFRVAPTPHPEAHAIVAVAEAVRDEYAHLQREVDELRTEVEYLIGKIR